MPIIRQRLPRVAESQPSFAAAASKPAELDHELAGAHKRSDCLSVHGGHVGHCRERRVHRSTPLPYLTKDAPFVIGFANVFSGD
jgi:hypothetical protein